MPEPAMRSTTLGRGGPRVSVVGMGRMFYGQVDAPAVGRTIHAAIDAGVTLCRGGRRSDPLA